MKNTMMRALCTAALLLFVLVLFAACPGGRGMVSGMVSSTAGSAEELQAVEARSGNGAGTVEGGGLEDLISLLASDISIKENEISIIIRPTQFDFADHNGWESRVWKFAAASDGRLSSAEMFERGPGGTKSVASYRFESSGKNEIAVLGGKESTDEGIGMPAIARLRSAEGFVRLSGSVERLIAFGKKGALDFSAPDPGQYSESYETVPDSDLAERREIRGGSASALREGKELWAGRYLLDESSAESLRGRFVQRPAGEDEGMLMGMGAADVVTTFRKSADGMWIFRTEGPEPVQEGILIDLQKAMDVVEQIRMENIALIDFVLGPNNGLRPLLALAAGLSTVH